MGAILTQTNQQGRHTIIAYASQKIQGTERNLVEMQATLCEMERLQGQPFTLYIVHWPLEKLGQVHAKTLNQVQEAMQKIHLQKGSEMPADYLYCNIVDAIAWQPNQMQQEQELDPLVRHLKRFLLYW
jgi:hypothetical protein